MIIDSKLNVFLWGYKENGVMEPACAKASVDKCWSNGVLGGL